MQAAESAGRKYRSFGFDHEILAVFEVIEDRSGDPASLVHDQFHGGLMLQDRDLIGMIQDLIAQGAADGCAGIIARGVHALTAGAAARFLDHCSVGIAVEHNAQTLSH